MAEIALVPTSKFTKDLKRLNKRNYDFEDFDKIIDLLAAGKPIPKKYKPHALTENRKGIIDVHIKPDWILLYEPVLRDNASYVILRRTGTHADILEK
ncbi:MAG: type II toxin-antitoxin system YafQ family toxin [Coriobacteriales bacterium]|jgi:mRNA interferase YafQ|nr:type II toxin-antitoxin system YafQ family toxin [Coriobacteriales bacterium]